ncbi:LYR motif-containing protein 4 isoform 2-T2 [Morphnus guianensis]
MAASSRAQVLRLYRALLRESQRFGGYNYRTYAIRRIRDAFRENKNIKDSEKIEELVNKAKVNLEVIHRQARSPGCFLGVSEACTGHVGSSSTDHKHQTSTASQSCLLNTIKNEILCSMFDIEVFRRIFLVLEQNLERFREIN